MGMPIEKLSDILRKKRAESVNLTPLERRANMEANSAKLQPPGDEVREDVTANGVPAEWIAAPGTNLNRQILYLHGGGYNQGSPNTHRLLGYNLSKGADARVLMADYRLAPEHVFPAAVEDAVAAYKWMLDQGANPARIAIGGDSAGGGLTVAALLSIRDEGLPTPAAGLCISPWVDLAGTGDSLKTKMDEDPMVSADGLKSSAKLYLGDADPKTPLASPLYADLAGLPPLLIQVGSAEVLLDDSTRLAERAKIAGVDVTLKEWDKMVHVWHVFEPMLDEAKAAIAEAADFIKARTV